MHYGNTTLLWIYIYGILLLIEVVILVFALGRIVRSREDATAKGVWTIIALVFPIVGGIMTLLVMKGRRKSG